MSRKTLLAALLFGTLCGCNGEWFNVPWSSGDRVLVAKCLYDTGVVQPHRYDVVVFKFPEKPIEKGTPKNYIKRLIGLPGEIIAIFFGRLYRCAPEDAEQMPFRKEDENVPRVDLWKSPNMHENNPDMLALFDKGLAKFEILRKPPDVMLAMRRIVFDNDYQPKDLENMVPPRWDAKRTKAWSASDSNRAFTHKGDQDAVDWLRYRHLVVERSARKPAAGGQDIKPQLITDMMGYNHYMLEDGTEDPQGPNWAGDLMLEFDVDIQQAQGELIVELSKGINRFQARFDLADGNCKLIQINDGKETELASKPTRLTGTGLHTVRFANIDARLTVWVDRELPFGEGVAYAPPEVRDRGEVIDEEALKKRRGPTTNDLEPASVGTNGAAVTLRHVRLWRDTYYTTDYNGPDFDPRPAHGPDRWKRTMPDDAWSDPTQWSPLQNLSPKTLYVQPGHYLCLGDNSTASSDSRYWGLVPERLLLGRALAVYYPLHRLGPIR